MSVQGSFTVNDSDDGRFVSGQTYHVRLYADGHFDADNEQAKPTTAPEPTYPPGGAESYVVDPPDNQQVGTEQPPAPGT